MAVGGSSKVSQVLHPPAHSIYDIEILNYETFKEHRNIAELVTCAHFLHYVTVQSSIVCLWLRIHHRVCLSGKSLGCDSGAFLSIICEVLLNYYFPVYCIVAFPVSYPPHTRTHTQALDSALKQFRVQAPNVGALLLSRDEDNGKILCQCLVPNVRDCTIFMTHTHCSRKAVVSCIYFQ